MNELYYIVIINEVVHYTFEWNIISNFYSELGVTAISPLDLLKFKQRCRISNL